MSLDNFIATVRAVGDSDDPRQALEDCRKTMINKIESARTLAEVEAAYLYYKAFYEFTPYTLLEDLDATDTTQKGDHLKLIQNNGHPNGTPLSPEPIRSPFRKATPPKE